MSVPSASPRGPVRGSVKVTYAGKNRRKISNVGHDDGESVSSEEGASGTELEKGRETAVTACAESEEKKSKVHKRVDSLDLPGPAPRHKRSHSKDSTASRKKSRAHERLSSIDMSKPPKTPTSVRAAGEAPLSVITSKLLGTQMMKRMQTPETDSPAAPHSPEGQRQRISKESDRLSYFQSHPEVGEVEPHRVFCKLCSKWLKLHPTQRYALAAWKAHKLLCSPSKPARKGKLILGADPASPSPRADDDDASSVAPSVSASEASLSMANSTTIKRTVEERLRYLEEDDCTGEVREHEVYCTPCKKWIKLSTKQKYALGNWQVHAKSKHGKRGDGGPSSRVQEAERKLQLVNDAQAKDFSANRVTCKLCDGAVHLSDKVPYEVVNWLAHKAVCSLSSSTTASIPPLTTQNVTEASLITPTSPVIDTSLPPRPPTPSASSDVTFVNTVASGSPSRPIAGTKRPREEEGIDENTAERPAVKPRTESYVPPDLPPPRPWGWLWLPWESFKRGFAEGFWSSGNPT